MPKFNFPPILTLIASAVMFLLVSFSFAHGQNFEQDARKNSTKKFRLVPNHQTRRIGAAVNWEPDYASAQAKSNKTGKPILWYVPTVNGTFMDRKTEIDRYMLAGPFSWPDIVDVVNEHYVPVKVKPTRQQQSTFQLQPFKFIEPGFLIIDQTGSTTCKVDRITTLHPIWFRHLLTRDLFQPIQPHPKPNPLAAAWEQFVARDYDAAILELKQGEQQLLSASAAHQCESNLLAGMATFRSGRHAEAQQIWKTTSQRFPNEPLAWKAAAESQGAGPFMRGFEVHGQLPETAFNAGVDSKGSAAPLGTYDETRLWQNGIEFLLGMQSQNGGFNDCDYDFGGTDSLPNVHVAVTALAGMAMLKSIQKNTVPEPTRAHAAQAIRRAISYVTDESKINKVDRDEILWAYAYRVRFLARCSNHKETELGVDKPALAAALANSVEALQNVQSRGGGWYHEYNNPFVTATALLALHEASQSGATVDQTKIQKGLASLLSDRFQNGAYPYNSSGRPVNRSKPGTADDVAASAGRMPGCELALFLWNQSSDKALTSAIVRSVALHEHLDAALKYDEHTSRMAYGGFFFWYDMRSRSEAIANVKDGATRARLEAAQKAIIMELPELDGCFVDSHELGRVYGTAMALLSLANCEK